MLVGMRACMLASLAHASARAFLQADYEDAIMASSRVLFICGLPYYTRKHGYLIDGGFTDLRILEAIFFNLNFCSFHNQSTTSVCPFYCSRASVRPSRYISVWWSLFPPPREKLYGVYKCDPFSFSPLAGLARPLLSCSALAFLA
jgi:hypothetical protein